MNSSLVAKPCFESLTFPVKQEKELTRDDELYGLNLRCPPTVSCVWKEIQSLDTILINGFITGKLVSDTVKNWPLTFLVLSFLCPL